eukprot:SAG31_NODE_11687_length_1006_cov_1.782800_2_plen_76_part_00
MVTYSREYGILLKTDLIKFIKFNSMAACAAGGGQSALNLGPGHLLQHTRCTVRYEGYVETHFLVQVGGPLARRYP